MPLPDLNKAISKTDNLLTALPIKENPLAAQLGIKSTNDNILQFFNRFGENNLLQDRPLSTVIAKPYFFNVVWSFTHEMDAITGNHIGPSKVEKLLMASMRESNTEALKYFIQGINLPDIDMHEPMETTSSEFGMISNPGIFVKPTTNTFSIDFLSSEFSLHEHVFYYWMREVGSHTWVYANRPFTKADLKITFFESKSKNHMFSYVLTNVFPSSITTLKPQHENEQTTRPVEFTFDNIYVLSANKVVQDRLEKAFDKFIGDKLSRALTTGINKQLPTIPGV